MLESAAAPFAGRLRQGRHSPHSSICFVDRDARTRHYVAGSLVFLRVIMCRYGSGIFHFTDLPRLPSVLCCVLELKLADHSGGKTEIFLLDFGRMVGSSSASQKRFPRIAGNRLSGSIAQANQFLPFRRVFPVGRLANRLRINRRMHRNRYAARPRQIRAVS